MVREVFLFVSKFLPAKLVFESMHTRYTKHNNVRCMDIRYNVKLLEDGGGTFTPYSWHDLFL